MMQHKWFAPHALAVDDPTVAEARTNFEAGGVHAGSRLRGLLVSSHCAPVVMLRCSLCAQSAGTAGVAGASSGSGSVARGGTTLSMQERSKLVLSSDPCLFAPDSHSRFAQNLAAEGFDQLGRSIRLRRAGLANAANNAKVVAALVRSHQHCRCILLEWQSQSSCEQRRRPLARVLLRNRPRRQILLQRTDSLLQTGRWSQLLRQGWSAQRSGRVCALGGACEASEFRGWQGGPVPVCAPAAPDSYLSFVAQGALRNRRKRQYFWQARGSAARARREASRRGSADVIGFRVTANPRISLSRSERCELKAFSCPCQSDPEISSLLHPSRNPNLSGRCTRLSRENLGMLSNACESRRFVKSHDHI